MPMTDVLKYGCHFCLASYFSISLLHAQNPDNNEPPTGMWIDAIPNTIDLVPDLLPQQSDHKTVPNTALTADVSLLDRTQSKFSGNLQNYAQGIDHWFGIPNPNKLASASVRVMIDSYWNEHDSFSLKPRVRGKINLPTLKERFSVVFGDDSIDNELKDNVAISNENPSGDSKKTVDTRQSRDDNASLAVRWSNWRKPWGFESDLDLGIRSVDDVYLRAKLQKSWDLDNNFSTHTEQIYRYGMHSEHYLRTNLELRHARPNRAFFSDQLSLTYTDDGEQSFSWDNRIFRQHQFFHDHWFNYGIYTGGEIENNQPELNQYGPFISWRQPFLREWFFVQTELNYYNNKNEHRDHYIGALLRLETHFK